MIIDFGRFKGYELKDIPEDKYVEWLALRGSYPEPGNKFKTKWKVPIVLSILARREMERRGYTREDDKYIK